MAVGETGLDHYRDYAPRPAQRRLFEEHLELAEELGLPVVIHSRAAARETADVLSGFGGDVILHCFSEPELLDVALERRLLRLVRRQRHVSEGDGAARGGAAGPADRILAETDSPFLAPQRWRGRPNEPAYRRRHDRGARDGSRHDREELAAAVDENANRVFAIA